MAWDAEARRLQYEVTAEVARLLGSERDWPPLPPLDVDGLGEDYLAVAKLKADRARRGRGNDDED